MCFFLCGKAREVVALPFSSRVDGDKEQDKEEKSESYEKSDCVKTDRLGKVLMK